MPESQEQRAVLKIANKILADMHIYLSGSCAQEMNDRHMDKARVIAAALLEARANGISRAMFVPFPHNNLYEEAKRLMAEAAELRERKPA